MKTNRELNQEHEQRESLRVRPKTPEYNWEPLDEAVRKMIERSRNDS